MAEGHFRQSKGVNCASKAAPAAPRGHSSDSHKKNWLRLGLACYRRNRNQEEPAMN